MNKPTRKVFIGVLAAVLLSASLVVLAVITGIKEKNLPQSASVIIIAIIILIGFVIFGARRMKSVKAGLPLEDERSRKVMARAMAQAYLISIYWLLALMWLSSDYRPDMPAHAALGMGIGGMAVIFFICWAWYNKKGDV